MLYDPILITPEDLLQLNNIVREAFVIFSDEFCKFASVEETYSARTVIIRGTSNFNFPDYVDHSDRQNYLYSSIRRKVAALLKDRIYNTNKLDVWSVKDIDVSLFDVYRTSSITYTISISFEEFAPSVVDLCKEYVNILYNTPRFTNIDYTTIPIMKVYRNNYNSLYMDDVTLILGRICGLLNLKFISTPNEFNVFSM